VKKPPMTEFEREAATLVESWEDNNGLDSLDTASRGHLVQMIATTLASHARPAAGYIREATGPDRKVLGTLPLTGDGCVLGDMASAWMLPTSGEVREVKNIVPCAPYALTMRPFNLSAVYSTKKAAEAARLTPAAQAKSKETP